MDNPFVYGKEVFGPAFTDRAEEFKELTRDLKHGQNVIIYSPRRYGKTSLIKKVLASLKKQGLITVYVDLYKATSKQKFIDIFAQAIGEQTAGSVRKGFEFVKSFLPRLLPKMVLRPSGLPEIEFEYNHRKSVFPLLPDLLEAANKLAVKRKRKAVVAFDEFQEIAGFEDDEVEREMRSHFQAHRQVAYVFLGSKQHLMRQLFLNKNRPFYHSGKHFQLGKISKADFASFISNNFKAGGLAVGSQAVDFILSKTECHPYYTQLFCSSLWDYCFENNKKSVAAEDLEKTLTNVLKREAHAYGEIWEGLKENARLLIETLAKYDSAKVFSADFMVETHLGSPSSVQRAVKALEERGIIERQNGNYYLADVFFKRWLIENIL